MTQLMRQSNNGAEVGGGEIVEARPPSAIEALTRAELAVSAEGAKRNPRSYQRFMQEAKAMVALDPDLAAQCTYVLKGKRREDGSPVSGPSVRLAEICALCWGGVSIGGRIIDDDGKFVTAQAVAIDLERDVRYSVEVKRAVVTNTGRRYSDDMVRVTCQAAIAIATRNVTFKIVPMAFVSLIEAEAQRVAVGDVKTLPERTERAVRYFTGKGVPEGRIYEALGISGPADMTLDLLATLNGFKVALTEGHSTIDELFPAPAPAPAAAVASVEGPPAPKGTKSARLAEKIAPAPAAAPPPAPAPAPEPEPAPAPDATLAQSATAWEPGSDG